MIAPTSQRRRPRSPLTSARFIWARRLVALSLGGALLGLSGAIASTPGPLQVHPENPRWFATPAGDAIWLTGSHTWATLQERGEAGETPDFDYPAYLDFMVEHGHNFLRMWVWEHAQWMQFVEADVPIRYTPLPFARPGPGLALDGRPKFDLTRFNPEFFARLRDRVRLAQERGIYVSVMLFQGFSVQKFKRDFDGGNQWHGNPYHAANNINGIDGDPSGSDTGHETYTLGDPRRLAVQKAYVRRVLETLNDCDNVMFEIGNELPKESVAWQHHMVNFVREVEHSLPQQHLVGMTGEPVPLDALVASGADWISPPKRLWLQNPPTDATTQIVIVDSDHIEPWRHDPAWVWRSLTRGHHFILMDGYRDYRMGSPAQPDPAWDTTRDAMGTALRLTQELDLAQLRPASALASSGFALAAPGVIVVYQEHDAPLTVVASPGDYRVDWRNPITGKLIARSTIVAPDRTLTLHAPEEAPEAMVVLIRAVE